MSEPSTRTGGRVLSGRYALVGGIGSGGAGVVWRAHDRVLDRVVALKLLHAEIAHDPAATARFRAEASAAAKLTHPHAVIVYDIGHHDGRDYLVMELVEGATLADVLDGGPLPAGVVAALGGQVAGALGAAHARDLVHRDVKPANVLVTSDGVAKVTDFGIARALGEATSRLTVPGYVMGTARYLAPEQLRDQSVDGRADVYSLGLLLHQALTGLPPFGDGTAVEVAMRRLVADLPRVSELRSDVPAALEDAIVRATQLAPDARFADGAEFAAALARLADPHAARELAARVDHRRPPVAADTGVPRDPDGATFDADVATRAIAADESTRAMGPDIATAGTHDAGRETTGVPADTDGLEVDAAPQRPRRRRPVAATAVVVLLVGVGAVVASGVLDREPVEDPAEAPADDPDDGDDGIAEPAPIEIVDGRDHDPFGSGEEHRADVPNAFDGDPSTTWQTQHYRGNPELGGLKPGVGIWLDLGAAHDVGEVVVTTTNPGASFTLYAGDDPPDPGVDPGDWGTAVATVDDAPEEARVELDEPTEGRVWLLWLTELPPDGGDFRATVSDVAFLSR